MKNEIHEAAIDILSVFASPGEVLLAYTSSPLDDGNDTLRRVPYDELLAAIEGRLERLVALSQPPRTRPPCPQASDPAPKPSSSPPAGT